MDGKPQAIVLHEVIPNEGDSIMIVNCGDHYEMRAHSWTSQPLALTDKDIEDLKGGKTTFN